MVRWCWVNFQYRGDLLIWIIGGQGSTALVHVIGVGGGCLDFFSLVYHFSFRSPSRETARYRLKYCLKGPLSPKQPTNQSFNGFSFFKYFRPFCSAERNGFNNLGRQSPKEHCCETILKSGQRPTRR